MPQSYSYLLVHMIFSTKERKRSLTKDLMPELGSYLGGVLKNINCRPVIVNGVEDHLHLLFLLPRELAAGTAAEKVKANSSRWLKTKSPAGADFQWQRGYSAFSVSKSNLSVVKNYILSQEEHHRKVTFQEELKKFLDKHEIEYDEHYLGD